MHGTEARVGSGSWRPSLLLLLLLVLMSCAPAQHLVQGDVAGTNMTELDNAANLTYLLKEEDKPAKVDDIIPTVTETSSSSVPEAITTVTPRAGRIARTSDEEQSSGMFGESMIPAVQEVEIVDPPQLIPDSAETDLLLPSVPQKPEVSDSGEERGEEEKGLPNTDPPWVQAKDTAVFDLDHLFTTTEPPPTTTSTTTSTPNPDVVHVDYIDQPSRGRNLDLAPPSPSSLAHELQGGDPTSWAMPDNYDYLTPYDDGISPSPDEYSYSTTTETYESDDDIRLLAGAPSRTNPRSPSSGPINVGATLPGAGAPPPNNPVAPPPASTPVDGSDGLGGCRVGYQTVNGSCRSPCDMLPNYCFNNGQCYLLDGVGVFCRCNVQDYIWHKGARCESVVTEFQVMCLAVGASALVVLLLFMIIVCFAKKLHVLKTENKKLRKRSSKYRPSSEQHNDNFSLSTIAEGSHPNVRKLCDTPPNVPHARALAYYDNIICQKTMSRYTWECKTKEESDCEDDPNSQNKVEDPVKAPPKEDDSLNIHNSLTPKHENHKLLGEENSSEVNSLQNNMM